jgi:hypothetical protein
MAGNEFEDQEAEARGGGERSVEQPEGSRRHRLVKASDPADQAVGGEEGQVIQTDDGGVDRFRRVLGEQGEADRQKMGESDAVDEVERDWPEEPNLVTGLLRRGGGEKAERSTDGEN